MSLGVIDERWNKFGKTWTLEFLWTKTSSHCFNSKTSTWLHQKKRPVDQQSEQKQHRSKSTDFYFHGELGPTSGVRTLSCGGLTQRAYCLLRWRSHPALTSLPHPGESSGSPWGAQSLLASSATWRQVSVLYIVKLCVWRLQAAPPAGGLLQHGAGYLFTLVDLKTAQTNVFNFEIWQHILSIVLK